MAAPTLEDLERYSTRHGIQKTSRALKILAKDAQFVAAWETEAGKEILNHMIAVTEDCLDKIATIKATDEDKLRYQMAMEFLEYFKGRINAYQKNNEQIKRG